MNKLLTQLHNFFIPPSHKEDEQGFRKARIFINSTLLTALFALFFLLNTIVFGMPYHLISMIFCTIFYFSLAFVLRFGMPLHLAAHLYVAVSVLATFWDAYYLGGLQSYDFPWICLSPVIAVLFGNKKIGIIWLCISLVAVIIMGILQFTNTSFPVAINMKYLHLHGLNSLLSLVVIMFVIVVVIENAFIGSLKKLDQKNKIIEVEKKRSDELLLNILPEEVMEELKQTGRTTARSYDLVTVMFADFKDFTLIGEKLPPEELVTAIDEYFTEFDKIIDRHEVEKIKTVGDAYLCAGGLPVPNTKNPVQVVEAAFDFLRTVYALSEKRKTENKFYFGLRIGIHSGPLVAGVVGSKKFEYDIWGDAVNTAARMQQNSDENKINISGTTYELIKHRYNCTHRGRIDTKNKGLVDMYFVDSKK